MFEKKSGLHPAFQEDEWQLSFAFVQELLRIAFEVRGITSTFQRRTMSDPRY